MMFHVKNLAREIWRNKPPPLILLAILAMMLNSAGMVAVMIWSAMH